jgi:hypothetical protein
LQSTDGPSRVEPDDCVQVPLRPVASGGEQRVFSEMTRGRWHVAPANSAGDQGRPATPNEIWLAENLTLVDLGGGIRVLVAPYPFDVAPPREAPLPNESRTVHEAYRYQLRAAEARAVLLTLRHLQVKALGELQAVTKLRKTMLRRYLTERPREGFKTYPKVWTRIFKGISTIARTRNCPPGLAEALLHAYGSPSHQDSGRWIGQILELQPFLHREPRLPAATAVSVCSKTFALSSGELSLKIGYPPIESVPLRRRRQPPTRRRAARRSKS